MSHSKPPATVNQKNSVLIICLHPGIRREYQLSYPGPLPDPRPGTDPGLFLHPVCQQPYQGSISHSDTGKHYTACLHPHL